MPFYSRTLHTGELTGELLNLVTVSNPPTAPVINPEKLLLLSLAVFTVTVGAAEGTDDRFAIPSAQM